MSSWDARGGSGWCMPDHPWPKAFIEKQSLEWLLEVHNNIYRDIQRDPFYEDNAALRGSASIIEEHLRAHGAVMLGEGGGAGSLNIQMSAPAPVQTQMQVQQPPQQNVIVHQQVQQPPAQQPAQQNVIYHQQVQPQPQPQQNVVYQQLQQPQVLSIPAPVATLTMTSTPVQVGTEDDLD
ncbi:hypothetical protein J4E85_000310 [Alternaria conjuncta]|uniref:uncharacterized protein n=1 Tax=Alternaria conjuncta TaxID=181017 RepID=UPI00221F3517|nr:uncharacterized protein J4E85_000310 [Alternaria conjuncta]KAI4937873.1 hypothetical protein J4E85_000310 [Alternaria conjuncta]